MKIAVISDIHGNYVVLEKVFKKIEKENINEIWCLGDIITKYPDSKKCLDAVKANCKRVVIGNCDYNVLVNKAFKYSRGLIGKKGLEYLESLPKFLDFKIKKHKIRLFHAHPLLIDGMYNIEYNNVGNVYENKTFYNWVEMFSNIGLAENAEIDEPDIVLYGHTHISHLEYRKNGNGGKLLINPGSLGDSCLFDGTKLYDYLSPDITYCILNFTRNNSFLSIPEIKEMSYLDNDLIMKVRERVLDETDTNYLRKGRQVLKQIDESLFVEDLFVKKGESWSRGEWEEKIKTQNEKILSKKN